MQCVIYWTSSRPSYLNVLWEWITFSLTWIRCFSTAALVTPTAATGLIPIILLPWQQNVHPISIIAAVYVTQRTVWKLSIFKHTEDCIILHHTAGKGNAPIFLPSHSKALAALPACRAHSAATTLPSTKPPANLLPNSFCYPTITLQAPCIPGIRLSKTTTAKKTQWETGWTFLLHQQIQRHQQKQRKKKKISAPTIMQSSSETLK